MSGAEGGEGGREGGREREVVDVQGPHSSCDLLGKQHLSSDNREKEKGSKEYR